MAIGWATMLFHFSLLFFPQASLGIFLLWGQKCKSKYKSSCTNTFKTSIYMKFVNIPLTKASHMAKVRIKGWGNRLPFWWEELQIMTKRCRCWEVYRGKPFNAVSLPQNKGRRVSIPWSFEFAKDSLSLHGFCFSKDLDESQTGLIILPPLLKQLLKMFLLQLP